MSVKIIIPEELTKENYYNFSFVFFWLRIIRFSLIDEIDQWCKENKIKYKIKCKFGYENFEDAWGRAYEHKIPIPPYVLQLKNEKIAIEFKLRWL